MTGQGQEHGEGGPSESESDLSQSSDMTGCTLDYCLELLSRVRAYMQKLQELKGKAQGHRSEPGLEDGPSEPESDFRS